MKTVLKVYKNNLNKVILNEEKLKDESSLCESFQTFKTLKYSQVLDTFIEVI